MNHNRCIEMHKREIFSLSFVFFFSWAIQIKKKEIILCFSFSIRTLFPSLAAFVHVLLRTVRIVSIVLHTVGDSALSFHSLASKEDLLQLEAHEPVFLQLALEGEEVVTAQQERDF